MSRQSPLSFFGQICQLLFQITVEINIHCKLLTHVGIFIVVVILSEYIDTFCTVLQLTLFISYSQWYNIYVLKYGYTMMAVLKT